jgi:hypothetical protein
MGSSELRQKGAAVARFFHQIILKFEPEKRGSRVYGKWVHTAFLLTPEGMVGMLSQPGLIVLPDIDHLFAEQYNSGGTAGRPR